MQPHLVALTAQLLFYAADALGHRDDRTAATTPNLPRNDQPALAARITCPILEASLTIATYLAEELDLDCLEVIQGRLDLQGCQSSSDCTDKLTSIRAPKLRTVEGGLTIEGVDTLTEVSFPVLSDVWGSASVKGLKSLDTLDVGALSTVGNFSVADVQQLYYLNLGVAQAGSVSIVGNGELVVEFGSPNATNETATGRIDQLDISGASELRWGNSAEASAVGKLFVHDGASDELPLLFKSLQSLEVRANNELSDLLLPAEDGAKSQLLSQLRSIIIVDNEKLNLTTIRTENYIGTDMLSWAWPSENMDTVLLDGIIHGTFFQPLIAAHHTTTLDNASSSKPRVLLSFNITSTASTFNCDPLDELRRHGVFPGLYSCNGNTIDVPSGSIGKGGGRSLLGVAMGLMVAGLLIVI